MEIIYSINLIIIAADHLITGTLALFFPQHAIALCKRIFGILIPEKPEYFVILKPWGALGIFAGLSGLLPLYDSGRYEYVLLFLGILLGIRIYVRLSSSKISQLYFGVSNTRNVFHVIIIIISAAILMAQFIGLQNYV